MSTVRLESLTKAYGDIVAVDGISLVVEEGELVSLLGPSGCGKTTTLRMVAGLVNPTSGRVCIGEHDATTRPPSRRGVAMVFQDYALFPHMTVNENVAFGLRIRNLDKAAIRKRVDQSLELVALTGLEGRYPSQLSGGQQQRVALARAIAVRPRVLLLDEPLSNLDAKLREKMRHEIRDLQKELGLTTVYVTHDQEEALAISDRIAVMNAGRVIQSGTPLQVYHQPASVFVAEFVGHANLMNGICVDNSERGVFVKTEGGWLVKSTQHVPGLEAGSRVTAVVRPELIRARKYDGESSDVNYVEGVAKGIAFLGAFSRLFVKIPQCGAEVLVDYASTERREEVRVGDHVILQWSAEDVRIVSDNDKLMGRGV